LLKIAQHLVKLVAQNVRPIQTVVGAQLRNNVWMELWWVPAMDTASVKHGYLVNRNVQTVKIFQTAENACSTSLTVLGAIATPPPLDASPGAISREASDDANQSHSAIAVSTQLVEIAQLVLIAIGAKKKRLASQWMLAAQLVQHSTDP
jgi:hypothetical protein